MGRGRRAAFARTDGAGTLRAFAPEEFARATPYAQQAHRNHCPEIDCIRHRLPSGAARTAEERAAEIGVGADRVLVAGGYSEITYLAALGDELGIAFETLEQVPRSACPLNDQQLIRASVAGLLPLYASGAPVWIIAPRGLAARTLIAFAARYPGLRGRIRLTSHEHLQRFTEHFAGDAIAFQSAEALKVSQSVMSAAAGNGRIVAASTGVLAVIAILALLMPVVSVGFQAALATFFLAAPGLRVASALAPRPTHRRGRYSKSRLPVYTIVCALYREAETLAGLVAALRRLDYPALSSKCTKGRGHADQRPQATFPPATAG